MSGCNLNTLPYTAAEYSLRSGELQIPLNKKVGMSVVDSFSEAILRVAEM
jgi:hypothetical protein